MSLHTKLKSIIKPAVIIPSTLLFLTLTSALVLLSSNSNADTTSATASVTVPDTCYMSSTSTTHTGTVSGGTYTENFGGESTVTVTCNDRNGYSVYAVGYSNDIEGTNGLIGTSTGLVIPSGTSTSGDVSNWAMKLTPVTGTYAPTILSDANGSYANYHIVPTTTTKVATLTSDINVSNSSQFKTSYAVAVAPSQAADTYIGKVKYTVVHPNYANSDGTIPTYTVNLNLGSNVSSIIVDGTSYTSNTSITLFQGTHTISGTYPQDYEFSYWTSTGDVTIADQSTISTAINVVGTGSLSSNSVLNYCTRNNMPDSNCMQKMTTSDCPTASAAVVTDARNGSNYKVQRLADDNCWLLDNLAFDPTVSSLAQLYGSDTTPFTNATRATLTYLKNGEGSSPYTAYAVSSSWANSDQNYYDRPMVNVSSVDVIPSGAPSGSSGSNKVGVYYNYCAASAGSYCYGSSRSSGDASEDLCPKGWRMPTGGSSGEYRALYLAYGGNATSFKKALSTPLSGYFYNGSALSQGSGGYIWSSTWNKNTDMYSINVPSSGIEPVSWRDRGTGSSIRCILKQP